MWPLAGEIGEGDKGGVAWLVDTKHEPMWLDVGVTVGPARGIFKFEGETLVWATRSDFPGNPTDFTDNPNRPATFESTKENGWTVRYLKRTDGFWGWKPK